MYHTTCSDVYDNTALLSTFVSSTDDINVTDNWLLTVNIVLVARHKSKTRGTRLETETVAFETKTRTGGTRLETERVAFETKTRTGGTRLETETVASDTETKTGDEDGRHETRDRDRCLRDQDEDGRHETPDRDSCLRYRDEDGRRRPEARDWRPRLLPSRPRRRPEAWDSRPRQLRSWVSCFPSSSWSRRHYSAGHHWASQELISTDQGMYSRRQWGQYDGQGSHALRWCSNRYKVGRCRDLDTVDTVPFLSRLLCTTQTLPPVNTRRVSVMTTSMTLTTGMSSMTLSGSRFFARVWALRYGLPKSLRHVYAWAVVWPPMSFWSREVCPSRLTYVPPRIWF